MLDSSPFRTTRRRRWLSVEEVKGKGWCGFVRSGEERG